MPSLDSTAPDSDTPLRATLVFCPFTLPTTPPLGIASLKAHAEAHGPFRVDCVDLNLAWHREWAFDAGDEKRAAAARFLMEGGPGFFSQSRYNEAAGPLLGDLLGTHKAHKNRFNDLHGRQRLVPEVPAAWIDRILKSRPRVVGFSVIFDDQLFLSLFTAYAIKRRAPETRVVFGGGGMASFHREVLALYDCVDYCILNEGEEAFLALLRAVEAGEGIEEVPRLARRGPEGVVFNAAFRSVDLKTQTPPDYGDLDLGGYFNPEPVVPILTSRGCYWKRCAFCTHHDIYAGAYRETPAERVVDEIEAHVRAGRRYFNFIDEMIPAKRFRKIGAEILRRGLDIDYYALAKPTAHFTEETLEMMAASGCRYLLWGLESGNQRILDLIDKGTRVEEISRVFKAAHRLGIGNHPFVIIGFPSETEEDLNDTLRFLYVHREEVGLILKGEFILNKGTPIHERPEKFGITGLADAGRDKLSYEVASGIGDADKDRVSAHYTRTFFSRFPRFSLTFAAFRDHALLIYAHPDRVILDGPAREIPDPAAIPSPFGMEGRSPN